MSERAKKPVTKRWWFWVLVVFFGLAILGALFGEAEETDKNQTSEPPQQQSESAQSSDPIQEPEPAPEQEPEPEMEYIEVTATQLLADYDENAIAADNAYKDQVVMVTGTVGNIDTDITGSPYVTLTNDDNQWSIMSVQCYFKRNNTDGIATLKEGDIVTIVGKCSGKSMNVAVKDCELLE